MVVFDSTTERGSIPLSVRKFWDTRYELFSKFDQGIQVDEESLYSVTPEVIAKDIASQFSNVSIVVDICSGVGGNAIQFALLPNVVRVVCIEIDPLKVKMLLNNARIYNVDHKIRPICGDAIEVLQNRDFHSADLVFTSTPWGGVSYKKRGEFKFNDICLGEYQGQKLVKFIQEQVNHKLILFLPKTLEKVSGCKTVVARGPDHKIKANILYFGF